MKYNLYQPILNALTQQPQKDEGTGEDVTFGHVLIILCSNNLPDDVKLSEGQKIQIYRLKQKLLAAPGTQAIDLSTEEIKVLKERANKLLTIDTFGQLTDYFEQPLPSPVKRVQNES